MTKEFIEIMRKEPTGSRGWVVEEVPDTSLIAVKKKICFSEPEIILPGQATALEARILNSITENKGGFNSWK